MKLLKASYLALKAAVARVTSNDSAYAIYALVVILSVLAVKLWLASSVEASGLFADDYDYLNKSVSYVRGDFEFADYPFYNHAAGILYPILISFWQLVSAPEWRMFVVIVVNGISAGIAGLAMCATVKKVTPVRSLWLPLVVATLPCVFVFSFFALTENLLFAVVALVMLLMVHVECAFETKWWIPLVVIGVAAAPLIRAPGPGPLARRVGCIRPAAQALGSREGCRPQRRNHRRNRRLLRVPGECSADGKRRVDP